ncbi:MAG TPA: serine/threonine-protein kinase [Burkholderiales bacterium]|nr:serine/threonine-protein kinase [Burkholderiales bacterium]
MEPRTVGRYELVSELGRGAMGVVYKATDPVLGRSVAIKTINMSLERDGIENYEARFYQEARAAGGLSHPSIVTIYDVGKNGDIAYMAMEFVEGVELRALLSSGRPLPVAQAISIAAQVAEGLAYAHERGIVHRDIKPPNILVTPGGNVKIADFGIARMRASESLTQTGMMLGSPKYMSPEHVLGKRADQRGDLFSLGIILYEMLTGTAPFGGESVTALMYQIVNLSPPAPSLRNREVPELLDYVVAKMLAKSLEERYQSAAELASDLRECERQLASPGADTAQRELFSAGLSARSGNTIADPGAKTLAHAHTFDRTRLDDQSTLPLDKPAGHHLARGFDSFEATQRLAALTGAEAPDAGADAALTATQMIDSVPTPPKRGWRRRDWLVVSGAAILGALVARRIVRGVKR